MANETDKQMVDVERAARKGAIVVPVNPNDTTATIRKYDAGHSVAKIQDGDVAIQRTRLIIGSHNDYDAARGETKLIGKRDVGNAY